MWTRYPDDTSNEIVGNSIYIKEMTGETSKIKDKYEKWFTINPCNNETIVIRETLINHLCKDKNDIWHKLIENTDMTKNSKTAWRLIKRLNGNLRKNDG